MHTPWKAILKGGVCKVSLPRTSSISRPVCCSVLQCVAVRCNMLQWDAVSYSVLPRTSSVSNLCVVACCSALQCVTACYSVLQCVAACCSVLQRAAFVAV